MIDAAFWNDLITKTLTIYANVIFAVLWVGFAVALIVNREWLDMLWNWVQALPLLPKIIIWALILPIMVGLWIWESSWPLLGRVVGLIGIVGWTLIAVYNWFKNMR